MVNAIQRGDADEAAREMRAHIIVVRTAVDAVAGEAARRAEPMPQTGKAEAAGAPLPPDWARSSHA